MDNIANSDAVTATATHHRGATFVADGSPRRLHPLTLLMALITVGPRSLNFVPALLAIGIAVDWRWVVPGLALLILISLAGTWIAWLRFSWRVDADDIAIVSGVFSRNSRTIPFDRIQDVSIEQGLIARALGLAKVGFETGSGGGKDADASLNAIALSEAQALRDHIRLHRSGAAIAVAADTGDAGVAPPVLDADAHSTLLFAMTPMRILIAGIFNFSLAVFAVLFGVLQTFDNFLPFDPFDVDFWVEAANSAGLGDWIVAHQWLAAVGGLLTVLVLGLATGIIRMTLTNWDFRLARDERGFRRTRGLTTRTDVVIPIRRVQAAIVGTGFVRRWFGWYDLKLQSLASDSGKEPDHDVAPLARLAEIDTLLREVGQDRAGLEESAQPGDADWQRSHPIIIALTPIALAIVAIICVIVLPMIRSDLVWVAAFPAASAVLMGIIGWFDWRYRRWYFDGRVLHIADGVLSRRHIILPARNIQSVDVAIGPLSRRLSLAGLRFGVPGGRAGQHGISAIPANVAYALRAQLLVQR
ncbi:MAG: PH domain-containing protein [Sphingopyxis sp.]|nr:PH domain-containing protein [Sphingopyxis sp.]